MQSNWLPELVKRSETGPYMKEKDFEMALARRTAELVREYDLKIDPQVLVPADDGMADRLYQAGLQLFLDMGV
jgi:methylamine--corrinoid protein Co-methyltransferase